MIKKIIIKIYRNKKHINTETATDPRRIIEIMDDIARVSNTQNIRHKAELGFSGVNKLIVYYSPLNTGLADTKYKYDYEIIRG